MSRIGKIPVAVPSGVKVEISGRTAKVEGPLGKLIEAGLLTMDPTDDRDRYRFRHALLQEAVHDTIPKPVRRRYHRAYGEALAGRDPESLEQPERTPVQMTRKCALGNGQACDIGRAGALGRVGG